MVGVRQLSPFLGSESPNLSEPGGEWGSGMGGAGLGRGDPSSPDGTAWLGVAAGLGGESEALLAVSLLRG